MHSWQTRKAQNYEPEGFVTQVIALSLAVRRCLKVMSDINKGSWFQNFAAMIVFSVCASLCADQCINPVSSPVSPDWTGLINGLDDTHTVNRATLSHSHRRSVASVPCYILPAPALVQQLHLQITMLIVSLTISRNLSIFLSVIRTERSVMWKEKSVFLLFSSAGRTSCCLGGWEKKGNKGVRCH